MKVTSESIEQKLESIHKLSKRQLDKYNEWRILGGGFIVCGFIITGVFQSVGAFPDEQYHLYVGGILLMVGVFVFFRSNRYLLSVERRWFLLSFGAFLEIRNYSKSKNELYLEEAIKKLVKLRGSISYLLPSYRSKFDLLQEMVKNIQNLNKFIKSRILYCLQEKTSIEKVETSVLDLSDLFTNPNLNALNYFPEKWSSLPEGEFKPEPTGFQALRSTIRSDPKLSSIVRHGGTLTISTAVVMSFAYALTQFSASAFSRAC